MNEKATEVALIVIDVLNSLGIPYVIVGSLASSLHGVSRSTIDIDLVAHIKPEHAPKLQEALQNEFYITEEEIIHALTHRSSFNIIHLTSVFKIDLFVPKERPFDRRQLENKLPAVVATDPERSAYVASAEDTILAKLEWYKIGEEISERQWRDILGVLKAQRDKLNLQYLREVASELQVSELLERALKTETLD